MKKTPALLAAALFSAATCAFAQAPKTFEPTALATVASEITQPESDDVAATVEAGSGWLEAFTEWIGKVDDMVWGVPLIGAILVTGILLTAVLRFVHLFNLKRAFRYMFNSETDGHGEVSSFGALCTALSATIGTGNIVGVATAIGTGGPGALFWMEVAAFFEFGPGAVLTGMVKRAVPGAKLFNVNSEPAVRAAAEALASPAA